MRVISGTARGTRLATLPGDDVTRPTVDRVKEGMFSAVQFLLEGARVLDLFSGSGQLVIEALSRGAAYCVFVETDSGACKVIHKNLQGAQMDADVLQMPAESYLSSCSDRFDLILLDPPYHHGTVQALLPSLDKVLAPGGVIMAETEYGAEMPETCGDLHRKKQYKYGTVALTRYEKDLEQ